MKISKKVTFLCFVLGVAFNGHAQYINRLGMPASCSGDIVTYELSVDINSLDIWDGWVISGGGVLVNGSTSDDDQVSVRWDAPGSIWAVGVVDEENNEFLNNTILSESFSGDVVGGTISVSATVICSGSITASYSGSASEVQSWKYKYTNGSWTTFSGPLTPVANVQVKAVLVSPCGNLHDSNIKSVSVNLLPDASAVGLIGGGSYCSDSPVGKTISVVGSTSWLNANQFVEFSLYRNGSYIETQIIEEDDLTDGEITFGPYTQTGSYTAKMEDTNSSCGQVALSGGRSISSNAPESFVLYGGNNYQLCPGEDLILSTNSANVQLTEYQNNEENGFIESWSNTGGTITAQVSRPGMYTLKLPPGSCVSSATQTITVTQYPIPSAPVVSNPSQSSGCLAPGTPASFTFSVTAESGMTYRWYRDSDNSYLHTGSSYSPSGLGSGTHRYRVRAYKECPNKESGSTTVEGVVTYQSSPDISDLSIGGGGSYCAMDAPTPAMDITIEADLAGWFSANQWKEFNLYRDGSPVSGYQGVIIEEEDIFNNRLIFPNTYLEDGVYTVGVYDSNDNCSQEVMLFGSKSIGPRGLETFTYSGSDTFLGCPDTQVELVLPTDNSNVVLSSATEIQDNEEVELGTVHSQVNNNGSISAQVSIGVYVLSLTPGSCTSSLSHTITVEEHLLPSGTSANHWKICVVEGQTGTDTFAIDTPETGTTYRWYRENQGGQLLHTGETFTPPLQPAGEYSYYVGAYKECENLESSRSWVQGTVLEISDTNISDLQVFENSVVDLQGMVDPYNAWFAGEGVSGAVFNAFDTDQEEVTIAYEFVNDICVSESRNFHIDVDPVPGLSLTGFTTAKTGEPVTITITDYSPDHQYNWYKNGSTISADMVTPEATTRILTNPLSLETDQPGTYQLLSTIGNYSVWSNPIVLKAPKSTSQMNYVKTKVYRSPETEESNVSNHRDSVAIAVQYLDGLGRLEQTVGQEASPGGYDLVQSVFYDNMGRPSISHLPYGLSPDNIPDNPVSDGSYRSYPEHDQAGFYDIHFGDNSGGYAFSETIFEASPLNRPIKSYAPGQPWAKNGGDKPVTFRYMINTSDDHVILWKVENDKLKKTGSYVPGVLHKSIVIDENGKQVQEFKNLQGQVILKKVQLSETAPVGDDDWLQTYYVYDEFNNLRYVLPPMGAKHYLTDGQYVPDGTSLVTQNANFEDVAGPDQKVAFLAPAVISINSGTTLNEGADIYSMSAASDNFILNSSFVDRWAFQYQYDNRQRMVMKQVPGADSVLMVYDKRDRLVMTQDGNQRANDQWSFTKYDELNRPVLTGIIADSTSRTEIQLDIDQNLTDYVEEYTGTGSLMGYDGTGYPSNAIAADLLTVTYYDNYGFTDDSHWTLGNFTAKPEARTLVTGSKVKVPGQTNWNEMITLYDTFFRVESTVSVDYQNNRDSLANVYFSDVLPLVTKTTHIHVSALTNDTTTLVKDFVYDHADRLLSVTHKINDETAVVILENEYNELGELTTKKLNKEGAGQYSQEVDYQYNIRGWLTKINDPVTPDAADYFNMQLKYDEAGQYNGNIGATSWKNPFETATNSYAYGYDPVNRIKSAGYSTTASHGMDFDVAGITYDANGNILTLQRTGNHDSQAAQLFDDLDYDYVGNQLTKVTDASGKDTGFKDGTNATNEYVYDANGNMIEDKNKGIDSIAYNHLNLPIRVEMNADGSNRIEYIYDAAGVKMAQLVYGADTLTKRTDYQGAFIYEDSVLQFVQHEEGRVIPTQEGSFDYQYHLKDHLGNVRATFKTEIDVDTYLTTLESDSASVEEQYFYNLDSVRVTYASANKTALGDEAARVGQDSLHSVGPAIALSVVPGDTIDMEVWAYYEGGSGYANTIAPETFIAALARAFGGSSGAAGESGTIFEGVNEAINGGAGGLGSNTDTNVPGAYLSYILFDQNYKEIQSGYHEISDAASYAHEKLFLNDITISQAGYLYIYTSMQSKGTQPVYFDDMKVTHTHSPIVSKDDYYPFGLTFGSYSRPAATAQNFKYNQGTGDKQFNTERVSDLGLNWDMTKYRTYDYALGRFLQVDPLADSVGQESWTPYHYGFNNSIRYNDPYGDNPLLISAAVGAVIGGVAGGIIASMDENATAESIATAALGGAVSGAIIGSGAGLIATTAVGSSVAGVVATNAAAGLVAGAAESVTVQAMEGEGIDTAEVVEAGAASMFANVVAGPLGGAIETQAAKVVSSEVAASVAQNTAKVAVEVTTKVAENEIQEVLD